MTPPPVIADAAVRAVQLLRRTSYVVLGGYAIALCYRCGVFRVILPKSASDFIESVVERIKSRTEPLGDPQRFTVARRHLIHVYSLATLGLLSAAAGSAAFFAFPTVPVVISFASALIPGSLLMFLPREMMYPLGRGACMLVSCFAFGYSFGPICWVAWDSLAVFIMVSGSTMMGLCVPLFLTRGMISYVLSSQLLSCALATAGVTTIPFLNFGVSAGAGSGLDVLRRADINVLLTMQLLSNIGINILHTLPTIVHVVRWNGNMPDLMASLDPMKESMCICAGAGYVLWRCLRWACRRFMLTSAANNVQDATDGTQDQWRHLSSSPQIIQSASGIGASLVLVIWYVRAVFQLQRGQTIATLEAVRNICARISPISLLVGGVYVP